MLARGHWKPSKPSSIPTLRSYHISSLYSPVGMLSWTDLQKYLNAREDPEAMRAFVNLYLGLPYKEAGPRPDLKTVIALRGTYRAGTVSGRMVADCWQGPIYLVAGIDVQRGKEKDDALGPRLEMEILGIGAGYRTWSIAYHVFHGPIDDPFSGAWEDLNEWAEQGGLRFPQIETFQSGAWMPMQISLIFVDSGDQAETVYRFCRRWGGTLPSKGLSYVLRIRRSARKAISRAARSRSTVPRTSGETRLSSRSTRGSTSGSSTRT